VEHEELVTGWVALVAEATGRSAEITLNVRSASEIRFFIAALSLKL
jgi:hypothetical protein